MCRCCKVLSKKAGHKAAPKGSKKSNKHKGKEEAESDTHSEDAGSEDGGESGRKGPGKKGKKGSTRGSDGGDKDDDDGDDDDDVDPKVMVASNNFGYKVCFAERGSDESESLNAKILRCLLSVSPFLFIFVPHHHAGLSCLLCTVQQVTHTLTYQASCMLCGTIGCMFSS